MRWLVFALLTARAFAAVPVVSGVSTDDLTHGSVRVKWTTDQVPDGIRVSYGATTSYGSFIVPYTLSNVSTTSIMVLGGDFAGTTQHVCPQSHNASGWSSCSGLDQVITFPALPAIHPELPIAPTTFSTSYPNTSGYTNVTVTSNCSDLQSRIDTATANRASNGTVIKIPKVNTCNLSTYTRFLPDVDALNIFATEVDISANTITHAGHGLANNDTVRVSQDGFQGEGLAAPLVDGIDYYVINVSGNVFQLSTTLGGSAIDFTYAGNFRWYLAKWPLPHTNWIVIRSEATDAELPPDGVRFTSEWSSGAAALTHSNIGLGSLKGMFLFGPFASRVYFGPGLHLTVADSGQASTATDPTPYQGFVYTQERSQNNIIFARNWIDGGGYPERIYEPFLINGTNIGIVDNYLSNWTYWRPWYAGGGLTLTSSTRVDVAAFDAHGGYFNCLVVSASHFNIVSSSNGTAYVEGTPSCGVKVIVPAGASVGCTSCTTATGTTWTVNGFGNRSNVLIGTVSISSNTFTGVSNQGWGTVSVFNQDGITGIMSTDGPGPYVIKNNFFDKCTGICIHLDESATTANQPADVTVARNTFLNTQALMYNKAASDGKHYANRQFFEIKLCARCVLDGNILDGNYGATITGGYAIEILSTAQSNPVPSLVGSRDVKVSNNTIRNGSAGVFLNGGQIGANGIGKVLQRLLFENNLIYNNDSLANNTDVRDGGHSIETGNGGVDFIIRRNTFLSNPGTQPWMFYMRQGKREGMAIVDNIFTINNDVPSRVGSYFEDSLGGDSPSCFGSASAAVFNCVFPNLDMRGNVAIPMFEDTSTLTSISAATVVSAYNGLIPSTHIRQEGTAALRLAAAKFYDSANNFRLRSDSGYVAGGHLSSDGGGVGANIDTMEDAQGIIKNARALSIATTSFTAAFHAPDASTSCYVGYGTGTDVTTWSRTAANTSAAQERTISVTGLTTKTAYNFQVWCAGVTPTVTLNLRTL